MCHEEHRLEALRKTAVITIEPDMTETALYRHADFTTGEEEMSRLLADDVAEEVKLRRLNEMIALQNELSRQQNAKDKGKTFEILVEGRSKRSADQLFGRTGQNKVVIFDRADHRVGQKLKARITGSSSATLMGEIVE